MNFHDRLPKNIRMSNFMKIYPVGAALVHADGWSDRQTRWS